VINRATHDLPETELMSDWTRGRDTISEPHAPPDPQIGVREPRRARPFGGAGTVLLEPPL
jgi:hypothetical protein